MQSVSDFFDMMYGIKTDPLRSIEEFYRERVSMFIPVIVKEIRREIDPVIREVNSLADEIINSLPGQSDKLPAKRTLLRGEPIPTRESIGPNWLSPLTLSEDKNDPIVKEIENNKISIPDFPRWIGRRGSESVLEKERPIWGIKLEPKQRERLAVIMTQEIKVGEKNLYDYLTALIKSESYKNASGGPDGMKAQRIQGVFSVFRERAIDEIQKEIPEIRQRLENKIKERQKALRGASQ